MLRGLASILLRYSWEYELPWGLSTADSTTRKRGREGERERGREGERERGREGEREREREIETGKGRERMLQGSCTLLCMARRSQAKPEIPSYMTQRIDQRVLEGQLPHKIVNLLF
jgi:hypothetical protein